MLVAAQSGRFDAGVGQCTSEGAKAGLDLVLENGNSQADWIFLRPSRRGVRRHENSVERTWAHGRSNPSVQLHVLTLPSGQRSR